jgi:hypothetical protein
MRNFLPGGFKRNNVPLVSIRFQKSASFQNFFSQFAGNDSFFSFCYGSEVDRPVCVDKGFRYNVKSSQRSDTYDYKYLFFFADTKFSTLKSFIS